MNKNIRNNYIIFLILALFICLHLFLISKIFFVDSVGNFRVAPAGYGDISLHLTQISKFAFAKFNFNEPIYYGAKLQYPFVLNLISGLLLKLSGNWQFSVLAPMYLLCVANVILLFALYKRIIKNSIFAALAVWIFFFASGFGAYSYINKVVSGQQSVREMVRSLIQNDTSTITVWGATGNEQNIDFGAPISLVFLHQRTFFLGLFGFLLVLLLIIKSFESKKIKYPIIAGIILGLMPLWHLHSFVSAFLAVFVFFSYAFIKNKKDLIFRFLLILCVGLILALPQMYYLLSSWGLAEKAKDVFQLRLGWMLEPTIGAIQFSDTRPGVFNLRFLQFIIFNFGVLFIFWILVSILIMFKKVGKHFKEDQSVFLKIFIVISLLLFVIVQLVRFQSWDYDNNKILVYWQLIAVPIVMAILVKLFEFRRILGIIIIVLFFVFTNVSGFFDNIPRFFKSTKNMPVLFDKSAQETADYIKKNISEDDLILTGESHLNIVSSLAGREVLLGYPGWLWTRGILYQDREAIVSSFYQNPSTSDNIFNKFKIKYILYDESVKYNFKAEKDKFEKNFTRIYENGQYIIYKVDTWG